MKLQNTLLAGAIAIAALSSCCNEDAFDAMEQTGKMQLAVDIAKPQARATSEVTDFPVIIYNAAGTQVASYNTVADVPANVTLEVGNYNVESHTPGSISKKMAAPYYKGVQDVEILKDITSQVNVLCKMQNSKITVNYSDEFRNVFSTWEITVNDGSETALSFTNSSTSNSTYWYFGEGGVESLKVNFRGVTTTGASIASSYILTKDQASESYDDDRQNFGGGDAITLNFNPTESTEGNITSITINANVTFTETNETVDIEVVDKPGFNEGGGTGGEDPNPGGDDETGITLNLPGDMSFSASTVPDKSAGDTYIAAENGLKSITVSLASTSDEMNEQLGLLNEGYGVDFINGAEIVGNQNVVALFASLNQTLDVPAEGATEYTFPIGNFFNLLVILPGEHTFNLTVTDMNGNTKSGQLKITITE